MNSLKTGVVVVVLLGVLYGVYRVLNMPDPQFLPDLGLNESMIAPPEIKTGVPIEFPEVGGTNIEPGPLGVTDGSSTGPIVEGSAPPLGTSSQSPAVDGFTDQAPPKTASPGSFEQDPSFDPSRPDRDDSVRRSGNDSASPGAGTVNLEKAWRNARALVADGELREALELLSFYYENPNLSSQQRRQLQAWLDPLAGKVIYSVEHHLEAPYEVKPNDTLESIARQFNVPAQLIYNINEAALKQHDRLFPGTKLKVLRGPFEATVDLPNNRLTLAVDGLYAGHFNIAVGDSPRPQSGRYLVKRKLHPDDQSNPVGTWLIDLGGEMAIHGSPQSAASSYTCIALDPIDAADVSSILSDGSAILIRR